MTHRAQVRRGARLLIAGFMNDYFEARLPRHGRAELQSDGVLDVQFAEFWRKARAEHGSTCAVCQFEGNCLLGDIFAELMPDPVTGFPKAFRERLYEIASFDVVTRRGWLVWPVAS